MYKKVFYLLLSAISLYADTSIFSSSEGGFGDLHYSNYQQSGVALRDSLRANTANYATWAGLKNAYFNLSFDYGVHYLKDVSNRTSSYDDINISGFSFALPFANNHIFGINLSPYSRVDIQRATTGNSESTNSTEKKVGGLNHFSMIYGKKFNNFSIAFDASAIFGNITTSILKKYQFGGLTPKIVENSSRLSILVINPGISTHYQSGAYSFGASFTAPIYDAFEKNEKLLMSNETPNGVTESTTGLPECEWPLSFAVGATYQPGNLSLSTDLFYTAFEGKKLGLFAPDKEEHYANYWKVAVSTKYHQPYRLLSPYYQKVAYKLGVSMEQQPIRVIDFKNHVVNDYSVFASLVTPFSGNRASIETAISYTISGNTNDNNYENRTIKVGFTFHNSNNWWLRKNRYDD